MPCTFFNEVSDDWVAEKQRCINPRERSRATTIENLFITKQRSHEHYFSPEEFSEFLRFKGLARRVPEFMHRYSNAGIVERVSQCLFSEVLANTTFADAAQNSVRMEVLQRIEETFKTLQRLDFIGPAVASACLALCYPELCGTADYIVPALMHMEYDSLNGRNPLFRNPGTAERLREAVIFPVVESLSANGARAIATDNYLRYLQELWALKAIFGLTCRVRSIEEALWSFGICFLEKNGENGPLRFRKNANPPSRGPFTKICTN
jgi:hypothetical protein